MGSSVSNELSRLLGAVTFAAAAHGGQKREDVAGTPYVAHPVAVAELLSSVGGVSDVEVLQAAVLHDVLEDTAVTAEELEQRFGVRVRTLVEAVSDDKRLEKAERKRLRIEGAASLVVEAQWIVLADKAANVGDLGPEQPVGWDVERKLAYVAWAEQVVAGCRGASAALEAEFARVAAAARRRLAGDQAGSA